MKRRKSAARKAKATILPKARKSGPSIPRAQRHKETFQCHLDPQTYELLELLAIKRATPRSQVVHDALILLGTHEMMRPVRDERPAK